ncbi:flagellar hook-length control protein FliK [Citrobacter sp. RHBSTW-00671]|uniref:flagellar hook-length control protein FliK n=1 Tax=Citrobacter sp. RHBSTW-00671 TaxID=2742660 RepID=UPI00179E4458|nr:flagellar hook-length control protein FliK [Citrobacter sp. RHBSTW-00671]MBA7968793.1 flagellar hook-length control protein FliK [Citrobacter sp. RHBSTW-00671]HCJ6371882.1 flagellar hook-length control protein FliK [Citrobacter freundii]
MNPVLPAVSRTLVSGTAESTTISVPTTAAENREQFASPQLALNAVAERLKSAKLNQQQSSTTQRQHENDPVAMQALMALLLAQPAVPSEQQKQPDSEMLKTLLATQSGNSSSSSVRQWVSTMQSHDQNPMPSAGPSTLPSQRQGALTQEASPDMATAGQQAKLALFSAQDLRVIAPKQQTLSTSQQISAQVKQSDRNPGVRPVALKKWDSVEPNKPAEAQSLFNAVATGNQSTNALSNVTAISTHSTQPATLSTDELGEKLTALLKDQIQFQIGKQQQISTIRLDPPSLGKLEIAVQLDAGKLMVHIGANQSDVCRSLQQFSENLRQHLTAQNFMEVNVQVSSEGQSQQQQQQSGHQQEEVNSALLLSDEPQYQQNESVLIKV